jgi:hypothetical protein
VIAVVGGPTLNVLARDRATIEKGSHFALPLRQRRERKTLSVIDAKGRCR